MDAVARQFVTAFENTFSFLHGKRIVLYGIGYRTGAILEILSDRYDFVGVMDKDTKNVGKEFFGKLCLAAEEVPAKADAVIIISVSFYDVIFKRISHLWTVHSIPIYYPNGVQALEKEKGYIPFPVHRKWQDFPIEELVRHTPLSLLLKGDVSEHERIAIDLIVKRLFGREGIGGAEERFCKDGRLLIESPVELGYAAYGPLLYAFLSYQMETAKAQNFSKLCFCARDGYLLQKAMDKYLEHAGIRKIETRYLKISRLLARKLLLKDLQDVMELASLSYRGRLQDFFWERFGIDVVERTSIEMPRDMGFVRPMLEQMGPKILQESGILRNRYKDYLEHEIGDLSNAALVDFGYTGLTQHALSEFLGQSLAGIYLLADMSDENPENGGQRKFSCCYRAEDPRGVTSPVQKLFLLLEAVYTAPYGTYISIDAEGFVSAEAANNQKHFKIKEEIAMGASEFITDAMNIIPGGGILDIGIKLMQMMFGEDVSIAPGLKMTFYMDDIFRYRTDRPLFDEGE